MAHRKVRLLSRRDALLTSHFHRFSWRPELQFTRQSYPRNFFSLPILHVRNEGDSYA
jgi:hypothetical protein